MSDLIRATQQRADSASFGQILSHLVGMFVHMWCVAVIWRCYCYFGDKKVPLWSNSSALGYFDKNLHDLL